MEPTMTEIPTSPDARPNPDLDHLYWHTELPVAEIARIVGRPARSLHQHATPLPAGLGCYRCGQPLMFTSRAQRAGERLRCDACGCSRRSPNDRTRRRRSRPTLGVVGRSIILVREGTGDPGCTIERCIDALADAGAPWDGSSLVVVGEDDHRPDSVPQTLGSLEGGVVAISSLCDLAGSQTERLQVLFTLTRQGWRVVAATDLHLDALITRRHLDRLDEYDDGADLDGERFWTYGGCPPSLSGRLINATSASVVPIRESW
jgi:hypothetical protein